MDVREPQIKFAGLACWVGRHERLEGDFRDLCGWLGIPEVVLPVENESRARERLSLLYDAETVELIGQRYAEDVDWLGYAPPKLESAR